MKLEFTEIKLLYLQKRRSVDKRGAKSNEAYVREVLGEMATAAAAGPARAKLVCR